MSPRTPCLLLLVCAAPFGIAAQDPPAPLLPTRLAQVTVRERIIIRIPRVTQSVPASRITPSRAAPTIRWKEHRGPRCIATVDLAGAAISPEGDLDLVVAQGKRLRAELGDECGALDFYSGFYVKPTGDGRLCADRDAIRARSGRSCPIERFHRLTARPAKPRSAKP